MKLEITDTNILQLAAAGNAAYGAHLLGWPAKAQDFWVPMTEPKANTPTRWVGLAMLQCGVLTLAGSRGDASTKKNMMKAAGTCWAAASATSAWDARKGHLKENRAWASAALQAGMAGLLLYRANRGGDRVTFKA